MDTLTPYLRFAMDLPADHAWLYLAGAMVQSLLESLQLTAESTANVYNVKLALQEALANIVSHSYAAQENGRIQLVFRMVQAAPLEHQLIIDLTEQGQSFNPDQVRLPDFDEQQEHGWGLFLMRSLLDELQYTALPDGNHWLLIKNFQVQE